MLTSLTGSAYSAQVASIIFAYTQTGERVEDIKSRHGISGEQLYPVLREHGAVMRVGHKVCRKDPRLPKKKEAAPKKKFGMYAEYSKEVFVVGDEFTDQDGNKGIVCKAVKLKPSNPSVVVPTWEYMVSFGQGLREV